MRAKKHTNKSAKLNKIKPIESAKKRMGGGGTSITNENGTSPPQKNLSPAPAAHAITLRDIRHLPILPHPATQPSLSPSRAAASIALLNRLQALEKQLWLTEAYIPFQYRQSAVAALQSEMRAIAKEYAAIMNEAL